MEIARRELLRNVILGGAALALPQIPKFMKDPPSKSELHVVEFYDNRNNGSPFSVRGGINVDGYFKFVYEYTDLNHQKKTVLVPSIFRSDNKYRFDREGNVWIPTGLPQYHRSPTHPFSLDIKKMMDIMSEYKDGVVLVCVHKNKWGYRYGVLGLYDWYTYGYAYDERWLIKEIA